MSELDFKKIHHFKKMSRSKINKFKKFQLIIVLNAKKWESLVRSFYSKLKIKFIKKSRNIDDN